MVIIESRKFNGHQTHFNCKCAVGKYIKYFIFDLYSSQFTLYGPVHREYNKYINGMFDTQKNTYEMFLTSRVRYIKLKTSKY